jgi:antitoxin VapB
VAQLFLRLRLRRRGPEDTACGRGLTARPEQRPGQECFGRSGVLAFEGRLDMKGKYVYTYSLYVSGHEMKTARLFRNGQSQAVRLPKEFRFEGDFVYVKKSGNAVILLPAKGIWNSLINSLDQFSDDFMIERNQPETQAREPL